METHSYRLESDEILVENYIDKKERVRGFKKMKEKFSELKIKNNDLEV
jgi:hypothetical protein